MFIHCIKNRWIDWLSLIFYESLICWLSELWINQSISRLIAWEFSWAELKQQEHDADLLADSTGEKENQFFNDGRLSICRQGEK